MIAKLKRGFSLSLILNEVYGRGKA